jgi:hypothetical protein
MVSLYLVKRRLERTFTIKAEPIPLASESASYVSFSIEYEDFRRKFRVGRKPGVLHAISNNWKLAMDGTGKEKALLVVVESGIVLFHLMLEIVEGL